MADMTCITLSAKNLHTSEIDHVQVWYSDSGRSGDQAHTLEATPRNLDATPRNLVIGEDIANDCLDTNIFRDGRGCHLEIVDELVEFFPLIAFREDWLHEPEVATGLALHHGKSHGNALANPVSGSFPNTVGDIPQTGDDGVTASIHRVRRSGSCGVEGLDLRLQN